MGIGGDGTYNPHHDVWGYVPTAQVWMGRMRTHYYRKPQSWPQLRAKAAADYDLLRALFTTPRRGNHVPPTNAGL
jgi:hypothetical protein